MVWYQVVRVDEAILRIGEHAAMLRYTFRFSCCMLYSCTPSHVLCKNEMACPTTDQSSNYCRAVAMYRTSSYTVLCNCCHTAQETRCRIIGLEVDGHDSPTLLFHVKQGNKINALLLFILFVKSIDCTFEFNIHVFYEFTEDNVRELRISLFKLFSGNLRTMNGC